MPAEVAPAHARRAATARPTPAPDLASGTGLRGTVHDGRLALAVLAALAVALGGCGNEGPSCGEGTVERNGACVVADAGPSCGDGTSLQDGLCVALDAGSDGGGAGDSGAGDSGAGDSGAGDAGGGDSGGGDAGGDDANDGGAADSSEDAATADAAGDATDGNDTAEDGASDTGGASACPGGCADDEVCDPAGICLPKGAPAAWTCGAAAWNDGTSCDCGCGAVDPDCKVAGLAVAGCEAGESCGSDGTCEACVPKCEGKSCGANGCGGLCGVCLDAGLPYCDAGVCKAKCTPKCDGKSCGDDGCGGTCGSCPAGETCTAGACKPLGPGLSCAGLCGADAASGCSCQVGCESTGSCCADFTAQCACQLGCVGKTCGTDPCGNSCGTCGLGDICSVAGVCVDDPCAPDPCQGHGLCSQSDGSCACSNGYTGPTCGACAPGFVGYPACIPDPCLQANPCSGHGSCAKAAVCACDTGFAGLACDTCAPGGGSYPGCSDPCVQGGVAVDCDDGNACTADSCSPNAGCVHAPTSAACDDGDLCTTGEVCSQGACVAPSKGCDIAVTSADDKDDGTCDASHCSLREAIALANADPGPSVIGFVIDATVLLASGLPAISAPATIDGGGHAVVLDGGGKVRLLQAFAELKLRNLTLRKGSADADGGGAVHATGALDAEGVTFTDNASAGGGGAVVATFAALRACTFTGNSAKGDGGAVAVPAESTATLALVTLDGNSAAKGGAIASAGTLAMANCTLDGNTATAGGAALWLEGGASLLHCTVVDGSAGVLAVQAAGPLTWGGNVLARSGSSGALCEAKGKVEALAANLVQGGGCGATISDDPKLGALGDHGGKTKTRVPAAGSKALDAGDAKLCAAAPVAGVDQRGVPRPQGPGCDLGAVERKAGD